MSKTKGSGITAADLYGLLSPKEKKQFADLLSSQTPCERNGHSYKFIGSKPQWFRPPVSEFVCTRCGSKIKA